MKKIFVFLYLSFVTLAAYSQMDYAVSSLPQSLTRNANIVKRMEEIVVEIKDIGKATITTRYALTILNAAGDDAADFAASYSKRVTVKSIDGKLFDAEGKKIRSLKKGDIRDYGATGEGTLADEHRVKTHNFNYNIYPYTVEYEYEEQLRGIISLPRWIPVEDENYSVQQSRLIVQCPVDYHLRYKTYNYTGNPVEKTEKDTKTYQWEVKNLAAIEDDDFMPATYKFTPAVFLAPTEFEFEDYKGNMNDWMGFGKFFHNLNEGRDALPENIRQQIHQVTDPLPGTREKVKAVFEYLQKNTHYISVQLGIGGLQTFEAKYVAEKGYGDCKALSNYMYSLLKEAGIKSCHALIKSGNYNENEFVPDFPSYQFDHMILCVPQLKDTIWLECTDQTIATGYLSGFTEYRPALLIDESGGTLVYTPHYDKKVNTQVRKLTGVLTDDGRLSVSINTRFQAMKQDRLEQMINGLSKQKVLEFLKENIDLPSYDVESFEYKENKSAIPSIDEYLKLSVNNYAVKTGKRLFIAPNIVNRYASVFKDKERSMDIEIERGYTEIDSVEIDIPQGYKPESIPADNNFQSVFGKYISSVQFKPGKLVYYRRMERNDGVFPAKDYKELVVFYNKIYKADRARVVLVKEE